MTLLEIEAFLAVVKYGTLSTASQNLFISQPALTRRIQIMEQELGYPLFIRQKGHREVRMTSQGEQFYQIAWKWQRLWEETNSIRAAKSRESLAIATIDSASHNMLASLMVEFTKQGYLLKIYNAFSETAYQYMEKKLYELAFITIQDYTQSLPARVEVHPAYSESFVVASFQQLPNVNGVVALSSLAENKEVFLPWNKEFKAWHQEHFDERISPIVILEHYAESCYFLQKDAWMLAPFSTGEHFRRQGAFIYDLDDPPPWQIIYYLANGDHKRLTIQTFLNLLKQHLRTLPSSRVHSFL